MKRVNSRSLFQLFVIPLFFMVAIGVAHSQSVQSMRMSIEIGAKVLTLGMSKDDAVSTLREGYVLEEQGPDSYMVWLKKAPGRGPEDVLGQVVFRGGKLDTVLKYWGPWKQSGTDLSLALFSAVGGISSISDARSCIVDQGQSQNQLHETRTVYITCGRRRVSISATRLKDGGETTSVTEYLSQSMF